MNVSGQYSARLAQGTTLTHTQPPHHRDQPGARRTDPHSAASPERRRNDHREQGPSPERRPRSNQSQKSTGQAAAVPRGSSNAPEEGEGVTERFYGVGANGRQLSAHQIPRAQSCENALHTAPRAVDGARIRSPPPASNDDACVSALGEAHHRYIPPKHTKSRRPKTVHACDGPQSRGDSEKASIVFHHKPVLDGSPCDPAAPNPQVDSHRSNDQVQSTPPEQNPITRRFFHSGMDPKTHWRLLRAVGKGSSGVVYSAEPRDKKAGEMWPQVAVKQV